MKATLTDIRKLAGVGRARKSDNSGDINDEETDNNASSGGTQAAAPAFPCSSCCPTWRTTARCVWTG